MKTILDSEFIKQLQPLLKEAAQRSQTNPSVLQAALLHYLSQAPFVSLEQAQDLLTNPHQLLENHAMLINLERQELEYRYQQTLERIAQKRSIDPKLAKAAVGAFEQRLGSDELVRVLDCLQQNKGRPVRLLPLSEQMPVEELKAARRVVRDRVILLEQEQLVLEESTGRYHWLNRAAPVMTPVAADSAKASEPEAPWLSPEEHQRMQSLWLREQAVLDELEKSTDPVRQAELNKELHLLMWDAVQVGLKGACTQVAEVARHLPSREELAALLGRQPLKAEQQMQAMATARVYFKDLAQNNRRWPPGDWMLNQNMLLHMAACLYENSRAPGRAEPSLPLARYKEELQQEIMKLPDSAFTSRDYNSRYQNFRQNLQRMLRNVSAQPSLTEAELQRILPESRSFKDLREVALLHKQNHYRTLQVLEVPKDHPLDPVLQARQFGNKLVLLNHESIKYADNRYQLETRQVSPSAPSLEL